MQRTYGRYLQPDPFRSIAAPRQHPGVIASHIPLVHRGLTLVRQELQRRPPEQRPQRSSRTCSETCFTLLRRACHLSDAHREHLNRLLDAHPGSAPPGDALEEPSASCTKPKTSTAPNQALGRFADLYATGQIPEYREVVDTLVAWGKRSWPTTAADEQPTDPSNRYNKLHPGPTPRRSRVHQHRQFRGPRTPRNMSPSIRVMPCPQYAVGRIRPVEEPLYGTPCDSVSR